MSSRDDNSIPYIERAPGDLLTAEVWNQLQKDVKTHINDVKAIATDSEVDIVSIKVDDGVTFGDDSTQTVAAPLDADGKVNVLADGTVTTDTIADGAITVDKMAPGVIPTDLLSDGSVTEIKIADGAVTTSKVATGGISTESLSDGSVTETKIAAGAVTADKISDNGIGTNHIADNAIQGDQISESSIVEVKDLTVTRNFSAPGMVASNGVPTGSIMPFAGEAAPAGWLVCDGSSIKAMSYPALYSVIKTAYGDGTVGKDGVIVKDPFPTLPKGGADTVKKIFNDAGKKELFGGSVLDDKKLDDKTFDDHLIDDKVIDDKIDDTIKDAIRATVFNVPDMRGMFMRGWDNGAGRDQDSADRRPTKSGANGGDALGSRQTDAGRLHVHQQSGGDVAVISDVKGDARVRNAVSATGLDTSEPEGGNWSKYETRPMNIYVNYIIKT